MKNEPLIERLRDWFEIYDLPDTEVIKITEDTFGRSLIELNMSIENFKREIVKCLSCLLHITYTQRCSRCGQELNFKSFCKVAGIGDNLLDRPKD